MCYGYERLYEWWNEICSRLTSSYLVPGLSQLLVLLGRGQLAILGRAGRLDAVDDVHLLCRVNQSSPMPVTEALTVTEEWTVREGSAVLCGAATAHFQLGLDVDGGAGRQRGVLTSCVTYPLPT